MVIVILRSHWRRLIMRILSGLVPAPPRADPEVSGLAGTTLEERRPLTHVPLAQQERPSPCSTTTTACWHKTWGGSEQPVRQRRRAWLPPPPGWWGRCRSGLGVTRTKKKRVAGVAREVARKAVAIHCLGRQNKRCQSQDH